MDKHYNVQIHVQAVHPAGVLTDPRGYPVKGAMGAVEKTEKRVETLLDLRISAATEAEAYDRIMRLLKANRAQADSSEAEIYGFPNGPSRPIRDNPQA